LALDGELRPTAARGSARAKRLLSDVPAEASFFESKDGDRDDDGNEQDASAELEEQSLSQQELGFRARLHPTYVSGTERGCPNVSLRSIVVLAEPLRADPGELMQGLRSDRRR
jgi:hypothetical protein